MTDQLIGFDAREMSQPFEASWGDCRIETFLMKTDGIVKPLSVDSNVWLRVFDLIELNLIANEEAKRFLKNEYPSWTGANAELWDDLSALEAFCLRCRHFLPTPYWLVGVTVIPDEIVETYFKQTHPSYTLLYLEKTSPERLSPDWQFLGYDIADTARLSGLSNCGRGAEESSQNEAIHSQKELALSLNQYHLFDSYEPADRFRQIANALVPDHAPFFIYGLYKIAEYGALR